MIICYATKVTKYSHILKILGLRNPCLAESRTYTIGHFSASSEYTSNRKCSYYKYN